MPGSFLARYRAGDSIGVWKDLVALGPLVRTSELFPDAYAVAVATMQRVRRNVEIVCQRLDQVGYQFARPKHVFVPAAPADTILIAEIEHALGPLPLSLRAFYEIVGSVNLEQSSHQLIHGWDDEADRAKLPELAVLGEEDPLVVAPIEVLHEEALEHVEIQQRLVAPYRTPSRLYFCFAADEFHKAGYSGGEGYHVWLPDPAADFRIVGMYDIDEYFVAYLRATFDNGGFRGRAELDLEDDQRVLKPGSRLHIVQELAADLLPI